MRALAPKERCSGVKDPGVKPLTGKTLAEVARMWGESPEDAAIDLVIGMARGWA